MNNQLMQTSTLIADEGLHDMTLTLLYLSRISSSKDPAHYWDMTNYRASTTFDKKVLSWLNEVGFIDNSSANNHNNHNSHVNQAHITSNANNTHNNPNPNNHNDEIIITTDGVYRAREILAKLGIQDWDKAEIMGSEEQKL